MKKYVDLENILTHKFYFSLHHSREYNSYFHTIYMILSITSKPEVAYSAQEEKSEAV